HRSTALEQLVTAQPLLAIVRAAQTGSPNRHLLPIHYAVTVFFPPAMRATRGMLLMALSRQVPNFLLHDQVHQRQSRLAQQVAHSFLQKPHDLGHGKDHLDAGILFAGQLAEILHRSLLVDLVSSLHSDSPFFLAEKLPSVIMTGVESRYFLRTNGHPLFEQALKFANALSVDRRGDLVARLDRVRAISHELGYGVGDDMDFLLARYTQR